jgi:hypothetical protein
MRLFRTLATVIITLLCASATFAADLTTAQQTVLKADVLANSDTATCYTAGNLQCLADLYNTAAASDFWVWRTSVARSDVYNEVSPTGSTWSWTTFKNQGATEQTAWIQMFMGDQANFAKPNLRDGVAAIFTGSAQANAQQAHILAIGRRKATRAEKLFATGTGSSASPATMAIEGSFEFTDFVGL